MSALAERTGSINLGQGFPDEDGPIEVLDAAAAALHAGANQYAPLPGVPALRAAIVEHQRARYGLEHDPDTEVQVTFGATEAIAAALLGLCDPGDEVIALDPTYDSYAAGVALAGARLRRVPLRPPAWRFDAAELEAAVSDRTRLVLLNTPHNPTGRVLDRAELESVAAVCREHDLIAVTDEVYEHLVFDGEHVPLATLPGMAERTLTVSSIGKTFSVTGWKTGWVCGPAELVAAVRGAKQFMTFAGGTPLQHAAAVALGIAEEHGAWLAAELKAKRDRLCSRARGRRVRGAAARRDLLRQRRRGRGRRGVLPRAPRARGRRRDPHLGLQRRPGARPDARALRVLQARRGHRRGRAAARRAALSARPAGRQCRPAGRSRHPTRSVCRVALVAFTTELPPKRTVRRSVRGRSRCGFRNVTRER